MTWDGLVAEGLVKREVSLADHTTYRLGGPARLFAPVDDVETLSRLGACLALEPLPVLVLGRGSNLLVSDQGFPGLVVHLGPQFAHWHIESERVAVAGGALSLP
ncbi:MAG: UDP-N-acetylenolpyruvoylglucosamine reductase, partial [Acidimicrobiia bacterium]